jgi:sugar/nucleoside kinase (ribokinase family)
MTLNCVVIGDVNIDYVADLAHVSLCHMQNACIHTPITSNVGGNGIFFAEAATEAGFSNVTLLCSFGNDEGGNIIRNYLEQKHINIVNAPSKTASGKAVILYQPEDKRILIADRGSNKDYLSILENRECLIQPAELLYISGYALLEEAQATRIKELVEAYRSHGVFAVLDVVPHDIFHSLSWCDYLELCGDMDGIAIEASSVAGFMQRNLNDISTDELADFLLEAFSFCLVRLNSNSDFLVSDRHSRLIKRIPYQPQISSLRFTDRVIAHILKNYIADSTLLFQNTNWANDIINVIGDSNE